MIPNYIRNLFLPHPGAAEAWTHHVYNLTYLVGCALIVHWSLRARLDGDPMGRRLFLGFLGLTIPVVVEIAAQSLYGMKIRLSGFSLVILAMAIGTSWQWLVVRTMESRIQRAEGRDWTTARGYALPYLGGGDRALHLAGNRPKCEKHPVLFHGGRFYRDH